MRRPCAGSWSWTARCARVCSHCAAAAAAHTRRAAQVLRFYCQSKAKGEEEFSCFTVHYFLADGTIEVHAVGGSTLARSCCGGSRTVGQRANEGGVRVAFPTLLRRQRVPKAWRGDIYHDCDRWAGAARRCRPLAPRRLTPAMRSGSRLDPYSRRVEYVEEQDLLVGGTVDIYGRILHIVGCDKFTQEYYLDEHNLGQVCSAAARGSVARTG